MGDICGSAVDEPIEACGAELCQSTAYLMISGQKPMGAPECDLYEVARVLITLIVLSGMGFKS